MSESAAQVTTEHEGMVGIVTVHRPPQNYVNATVLGAVVDALEALAADGSCRAVVLASEGKAFCAGVDLTAGDDLGGASRASTDGAGAFRGGARGFYDQALRLFAQPLPLVAAIQGATIGGGAGVALACDLRVMCPEAYFTTNFAKLGIHQGFGISVTLPELIGPGAAMDLLLTGRRVGGEEALALGIANRCVPRDEVRAGAVQLAAEIAANAPLAVEAIRTTLRAGLADRVATVLHHELDEQARLTVTADAAEGIDAAFSRRPPTFTGR